MPVHPDDPLARCLWCPRVFVARSVSDKAAIADHESRCEANPSRLAPPMPVTSSGIVTVMSPASAGSFHTTSPVPYTIGTWQPDPW